MIDSLLIANRGEIACRIIRTARSMGVRTIAVYSTADADAPHVRDADEAVCLGPPPAQESYLNVPTVLDAARSTGAAAIHPGYGFLSENAEFAQAVADAGLIFVGPGAQAIRQMGSKIEAKRVVSAAGTPVVPGYHGDDQSDDVLASAATDVGYPLLIKASAGGGGKGMRLVESAEEFAAALSGARREAKSSFDDDAVLLERYLTRPKHIEMQLLADHHGNVVHLFERDCSVQRRHQKVVEEAPAPGLSDETRARMGAAAVAAARAIDYHGAGTVEFICEGDEFFFMEMNTRLQVEHPVTEAITGIDLVEWQLRVASGEPLGFSQDQLTQSGHAVEVRLYAENPKNRFLPSTGALEHVEFGPARIDTGVRTGSIVSPYYDPMLAKVICHGRNRRAAIAALDAALEATHILGVEHNVGYLRRVLANAEFRNGAYTTRLVEEAGETLVPRPSAEHAAAAALANLSMRDGRGAADAEATGNSSWGAVDGFRLNTGSTFRLDLIRDRRDVQVAVTFARDGGVTVTVDGVTVDVCDWHHASERFACTMNGARVSGVAVYRDGTWMVSIGGAAERFKRRRADAGRRSVAGPGGDRIAAPMPGQIISLLVAADQRVAEGDPVAVVEAMKMEHTVRAPRDGVVAELCFAAGDRVDEGAELIRLAPVPDQA